jgi:hypothetical protein
VKERERGVEKRGERERRREGVMMRSNRRRKEKLKNLPKLTSSITRRRKIIAVLFCVGGVDN